MPREDAVNLEGRIVAVLKEAVLFQVELANGHRLLGHVSPRRRREAAALTVGETVKMDMSPFDFSKGRIVLEEKER